MLKNKIDQYESLINEFEATNVLVVGDLILDQYIYGDINRISPEAPVPVVNISSKIFNLGGAANVASNIRSLQGGVYLAGVIGDDFYTGTFKSILASNKIDSSMIITDQSRKTAIKTRVIARNQHVARIDEEDTFSLDQELSKQLEETVLQKINDGSTGAIIFSDYNKGTLTDSLLASIIKRAKSKNIPMFADIKHQRLPVYRNIDVIKPNLKEASEMSSVNIQNDSDVEKAGKIIQEKIGCKTVVITRGDQGISIIPDSDKMITIPAIPQNVFDVTGAGDTVISTFTLAIANKASLYEAGTLANIAAYIAVGKLGTSAVSLQGILSYLKDRC